MIEPRLAAFLADTNKPDIPEYSSGTMATFKDLCSSYLPEAYSFVLGDTGKLRCITVGESNLWIMPTHDDEDGDYYEEYSLFLWQYAYHIPLLVSSECVKVAAPKIKQVMLNEGIYSLIMHQVALSDNPYYYVGTFTGKDYLTRLYNSDISYKLESPYVSISQDTTLPSYLKSLPQKRRYKVRNALKTCDTLLDHITRLSAGELYDRLPWLFNTVTENFSREQDDEEDFLFARSSLLFYTSVCLANPDRTCVYEMTNFVGDTVAIGLFVERPNKTLLAMSYVFSRNRNNEGTDFLALLMRELIDTGDYLTFNPCNTPMLGESFEPYMVYKRVVCNTVARLDNLAFSTNELKPPYYCFYDGWKLK